MRVSRQIEKGADEGVHHCTGKLPFRGHSRRLENLNLREICLGIMKWKKVLVLRLKLWSIWGIGIVLFFSLCDGLSLTVGWYSVEEAHVEKHEPFAELKREDATSRYYWGDLKYKVPHTKAYAIAWTVTFPALLRICCVITSIDTDGRADDTYLQAKTRPWTPSTDNG